MLYTISRGLTDKIPNVYFGAVAVRGLDNTKKCIELEKMLQQNIIEKENYFENIKVKEDSHIEPYREAFRALGINPNKYPCSIEALLTRIAKKKGFPNINAAVDLGNAISVKYFLPIGAHDLATIEKSLDVRESLPKDAFVAFGETECEIPDPGEIVYASGNQVRTRRWTWRQSEIGKITETTRDILFPIDGFMGYNDDIVRQAAEELALLLENYFGCSSEIGFVNKDCPTFKFFE